MARRGGGRGRVHGPYRHGAGWQLRISYPDGRRRAPTYRGEQEAEEAAAAIRAAFEGAILVREVLADYEAHLRGRGCRESSLRTTRHRLEAWLALDRDVRDEATPVRLRRRYAARCGEVSVTTQQAELAQVKTLCRWLVRRGVLARSPAEEIQPVGRRRRGKVQLRAGEARRLASTALLMAQAGDEGALAVYLVLLMGVRRSELLERRVRDVDPAGGVVYLWIDEGKTESAERYLEVPGPASGLVLDRVRGRGPGEWLWPSSLSSSGRRSETWLLDAVRRLCREAGVPRVTVHGLRGTQSTLARAGGATWQQVAAQLGHASPEITRQAYVAAGADEQARQRAMLRMVEG